MIYVHINENNKPWIDAVSTTSQEGYVAKSALLDSQIAALVNYPDKCYVDENSGAVITPQDLPMSEAEKNAQANQQAVTTLQGQVATLQQANSQLQKQLSALVLSLAKGGNK